MPMLNMPVYSATKAAIHTYSLVLREQLKDTSVKVIEIVPPMVDTDLNKKGRDAAHVKYRGISLFKDFEFEDTTKLGCGFDFKLFSPSVFYGIEVKGLSDASGSIALTSKEHSVASVLKERFFLFVVKNFRENPFHELYRDPLNGKLVFSRVEQKAVQISWSTRV